MSVNPSLTCSFGASFLLWNVAHLLHYSNTPLICYSVTPSLTCFVDSLLCHSVNSFCRCSVKERVKTTWTEFWAILTPFPHGVVRKPCGHGKFAGVGKGVYQLSILLHKPCKAEFSTKGGGRGQNVQKSVHLFTWFMNDPLTKLKLIVIKTCVSQFWYEGIQRIESPNWPAIIIFKIFCK